MPKSATYIFRKHPSASQRRESAVRLVKYLLLAPSEILPRHRDQCLNVALWKLTEAEGMNKCRTRFCSQAAYDIPNGKLCHDHVYQRAVMIKELNNAQPGEVDMILDSAIGCTVTKAEHELLDLYKAYDGWERYRRANISVRDCKDHKFTENLKAAQPKTTELVRAIRTPVADRMYILIKPPSPPPKGRQRQIVVDILKAATEPLTAKQVAAKAGPMGLQAVAGVEPSSRWHLHQLVLLGIAQVVDP
jgi:hypothetical protein